MDVFKIDDGQLAQLFLAATEERPVSKTGKDRPIDRSFWISHFFQGLLRIHTHEGAPRTRISTNTYLPLSDLPSTAEKTTQQKTTGTSLYATTKPDRKNT